MPSADDELGGVWHVTGVPEDWDPAEGLAPEQLADMQRDYLEQLQRRRASQDPPRDKWITPLLDWQVRTSVLCLHTACVAFSGTQCKAVLSRCALLIICFL